MKKITKKICGLAIFMLFATIYFTGCNNVFSQTETEIISFPDWPPENSAKELYPPLAYWQVSYFNGDFCVTEKLDAGTKNISLNLKRNASCAVVVQPVTKHGNDELMFFFPAGCIYPFYKAATWQGGWASAVSLLLFGSEIITNPNLANIVGEGIGNLSGNFWENIEKFNWAKLAEKSSEKSAEDLDGNAAIICPWFTNCDKIKDWISDKKTPSTMFSSAKQYPCRVGIFEKNASQLMKKSENSKTILSTDDEFDSSRKIKTPLSQFVPYQKNICEDNAVILHYRQNTYYLLEEKEIATAYISSVGKDKYYVKYEIRDASNNSFTQNAYEKFRRYK